VAKLDFMKFLNHRSCSLRELTVKGIDEELPLNWSAGSMAVAPATAKFAPWSKLLFLARYGFRNGRPMS
jgi:hypothetical protein